MEVKSQHSARVCVNRLVIVSIGAQHYVQVMRASLTRGDKTDGGGGGEGEKEKPPIRQNILKLFLFIF